MDKSSLKLIVFMFADISIVICFLAFIYYMPDASWEYGIISMVMGHITTSLQVTLDSLNKDDK